MACQLGGFASDSTTRWHTITLEGVGALKSTDGASRVMSTSRGASRVMSTSRHGVAYQECSSRGIHASGLIRRISSGPMLGGRFTCKGRRGGDQNS